MAGIGRIAGNDQNRLLLDLLRRLDLGADGRKQKIRLRLDRFQRVGQKNLKTLVVFQRMASDP